MLLMLYHWYSFSAIFDRDQIVFLFEELKKLIILLPYRINNNVQSIHGWISLFIVSCIYDYLVENLIQSWDLPHS